LCSGHAQRVLLLTADTYTRFLAPEDKGTRTIFGDAGTATWLSHDSPHRLRAFVWGTDGSGAEQLIVPGGALRRPDTPPTGCLAMNGPEVFNFTLQAVPPMVRAVAEKAGLTFEQIDLFVFHQANAFMLEHLRRKLAIPREKFLLHLAEVGNTVSSTIPLALQAALESGQIKPGMNILLAGFGVGLSWAGCVVEWNG
jgi:3-oxoacyl-[acyl-carrier-protein] synthase III